MEVLTIFPCGGYHRLNRELSFFYKRRHLALKIIVGISGATGAHLGYRLVEMLRILGHEAHVVISRWGEETLRYETGHSVEELKEQATVFYDNQNLAAAISSGSFPVDGMVIIPCSMKTLSAVANGYTENLIIRAADVSLKERRKLVLVTRETPLNSIHLRNMLVLSDMGAVIMPPVLGYYNKLNEAALTDAFLGRVLTQLGISNPFCKAWGTE